jgi:hypothetical protein
MKMNICPECRTCNVKVYVSGLCPACAGRLVKQQAEQIKDLEDENQKLKEGIIAKSKSGS